MYFWSSSTKGFYIKDAPHDAVPVTETEHAALLQGEQSGKVIVADSKGRPVLKEPAPHVYTRQDVESMRLRAYADPLTGSDRFFSEAVRLQVMGADAAEIEAVKALGAARYEEIQAQYPWPAE